MWDATRFRELVSGRRQGARATCLRAILRVAEVPYRAAVGLRDWAFERGLKRSVRVSAPVISVGNLTTGGTGKTPLAAWLVRWAQEVGIRVVLVSRGYGAKSGGANDEALELASQLPTLVHLQEADRVNAARRAIQEFGAQLILLDDGFQHRRLSRDLDIVLLDALEPFGFEHLLPRGLLREPPTALRRAHLVGLSRANLVDAEQRAALRQRVHELAPQAHWFELVHQAAALLCASGRERPWRELVGKPVAAFAGIGNPEGFRKALGDYGFRVVAWREFPDHHAYARSDLESLADWVANVSPPPVAVVCTHKDLVKIPLEQLGSVPLEALRVEASFLTGEEQFRRQLGDLDLVHHRDRSGRRPD